MVALFIPGKLQRTFSLIDRVSIPFILLHLYLSCFSFLSAHCWIRAKKIDFSIMESVKIFLSQTKNLFRDSDDVGKIKKVEQGKSGFSFVMM